MNPLKVSIVLGLFCLGCFKSDSNTTDGGVDVVLSDLQRTDQSEERDVPFADDVPTPQPDVPTPQPDVPTPDIGPPPPATFDVDLLFVIDNSGSMQEEQASLKSEIPAFIEALTGGVAPDGTAVPAASSVRVGVVTTDMGTGGHAIVTCNEPNYGDDGVMQSSCFTAPYATYHAGEDASEFMNQVECEIRPGINGCGFEQQLDAMLKALTPSSSPPTFVNGTRGHGDAENASFLRDDAFLGIIILSDEDDCSAADPDLFNRGSSVYTDPDLNLRCWRYGDPSLGAVHPISRYVDGILALKDPRNVAVHVVGGVPTDLAPSGTDPIDFGRLIGDSRDPRMVSQPDPDFPAQLRPSCDVPGRGVAYPPERMLTMLEGLEARGANVGLSSICQDAILLDPVLRAFWDAASR